MKLPKNLKKIIQFLIKNYLVAVFLACIAFVGLVSIYKLFVVKPTFIYARVKMGQGLWWASTQRPPLWLVKSIRKGDVQTDLTGKPVAEILSVRYYPTYSTNQYDVYLNIKLKVSGKYNFNRTTIGIGAPVDFEFPSSQFSGTIIDLSEKPIKDDYQEKIVYLTKLYASPWEYDGIKIGDKFFDGAENAVEILDKTGESVEINPSFNGSVESSFSQVKKNILVKVKLQVKKIDNKYIFGNEQTVSPGKTIYLATDNFNFVDYTVAGIE